MSVCGAKQIVGSREIGAFPFVRVDVGHHKVNFILRQVIHRGTFWNDTSNQLMILLAGTFLKSRVRVAEVDAGAFFTGSRVNLDALDIGELNTIVCQKDAEQQLKSLHTKDILDVIKGFHYIDRVLAVQKKGKLEVSLHTVKSEQNLAALLALDSIDLKEGKRQILHKQTLKIFKCTACFGFAYNNRVLILFLSRLHFGDSSGIHNTSIEQILMQISINLALGDGNPVLIGFYDVSNGLSLFQAIAYDLVHGAEFRQTHIDAFTAFGF